MFFAESRFSVPFASACYNDYPIYCNDYSSNTVSCEIHQQLPNSTLLGNALTDCTEGKSYQRIDLYFNIYYSSQFLEIPLNVSDNVTAMGIMNYHRRFTVRINPLKQHLRMTTVSFTYLDLDLPKVLSSYFPNLQRIEVHSERSINTIDSSLLLNLTSLSYLSWRESALVNISEDTFRGLSALSYIDLYYNDISYLSSETFQPLPSLNKLIVPGYMLNCTCRLQWMSIVDSNDWIDIVGECEGTGEPVDSPLPTHSVIAPSPINASISRLAVIEFVSTQPAATSVPA